MGPVKNNPTAVLCESDTGRKLLVSRAGYTRPEWSVPLRLSRRISWSPSVCICRPAGDSLNKPEARADGIIGRLLCPRFESRRLQAARDSEMQESFSGKSQWFDCGWRWIPLWPSTECSDMRGPASALRIQHCRPTKRRMRVDYLKWNTDNEHLCTWKTNGLMMQTSWGPRPPSAGTVCVH